MYPVTAQYLEAVQQTSREWDLKIDLTLKDGTVLHLTKADISMSSLRLKEGATCGKAIQVGSVFSNSLEFKITNKDKRFSGYDLYKAKVKAFVGLKIPKSTSTIYVPLGEFNILEPVKMFQTISVTCFDSMSLTNKVFDFSSIVFPTTCSEIFEAVVTQCGVAVEPSLIDEVATIPFEINSLLTNEPKCRDILAGIGLMLTKNLRFNRLGKLESFWYSTVPVSETPSTRVGTSMYGDQEISITGVYLEDAYGNAFSEGTEEYPVELPSSPIVQGEQMSKSILQKTLTAMQLLSFRDSKIYFLGDPALQAGDIVHNNSTSIGNMDVPIMRLQYSFAGTSIIECIGLSGPQQKQQTSTDKKVQRAFNKVDATRKILETKISQTAEEIRIEASETYAQQSTVANLTVTVNSIESSVASQTHDMDGLREEIATIKQQSNQVSIQIQDILDNGVDKVTTTMGYVFDNRGLNITKSGEEMSNLIDNKGMLVARSGEPILKADADGVDAENLHATTYLIVGKHARFENYTNGTDTNRTACFWI